MVNPINQNALLDLAMKAWDSTKQPLRSRGALDPRDVSSWGRIIDVPEDHPTLSVARGVNALGSAAGLVGGLGAEMIDALVPWGTYQDGTQGPAWPAVIAAPAEGMANFGRLGYDTPEAIADNARSAFDVAGGAMTGSLGVGLAGGMADDAVRVGGSVQNSLLESLQALDSMPRASGKPGMRINTSIPGREIRDIDGGVRITLKDYPVEENARLVEQLYTIESARGQGLARRAMEDVTREADAARSPLYLHVVPGDDIDHQRLTEFYRSLGFESLGPASMRRSPVSANAKPGAAVPLMESAMDQPQGIRAYHGSPHDFDKFDLSRIGTGEGWQGQGHGLYFGSVEPISTAYREQLTRNAPIKIGGRDMSPDARNIWANNGFDLDRAIAAVKQMEADAKASNRPFISSRAGQYASYRAELEAARAEGVPFPGHQYEVNIRANPNDFLDWATLDEATRARLNTPEGAKAAAEQGIPGIRYLDAMSRGAGEGSSNYVVFDDSLIDILRKYANAPTGAALPLAAEAQDVDPNDPVLLSVLRQYGMLN